MSNRFTHKAFCALTNILINGKLVYDEYKGWYNAGIIYMSDIIHEQGGFLTSTQLEEKFGTKINWLKYNSLKSAIPNSWKQFIMNTRKPYINYSITIQVNKNKNCIINEISNKDLYTILQSTSILPPKCIKRWENLYPNHTFNWNNIFSLVGSIRDMKLSSFQYKIIHRIFACRRYVAKGNKNISENCQICNVPDTLEHYFIECYEVNVLWEKVVFWFSKIFQTMLYSNNLEIIFGKQQNIGLQNFIIVQVKWFIFQRKMDKELLRFEDFLRYLHHAVEIEYIIYSRNNLITEFEALYGKLKLELQ